MCYSIGPRWWRTGSGWWRTGSGWWRTGHRMVNYWPQMVENWPLDGSILVPEMLGIVWGQNNTNGWLFWQNCSLSEVLSFWWSPSLNYHTDQDFKTLTILNFNTFGLSKLIFSHLNLDCVKDFTFHNISRIFHEGELGGGTS